MQIQTILVPSDFSTHADDAFDWALGLAEKWAARIVLFHATPGFAAFASPESTYLPDLVKMEEQALAETKQRLQRIAAALATTTVTVETRVVLGDPVTMICQTAEEDHADLIVMGSHGRTGLAHLFLGSVTERVVRQAPCPVLVTRLSQGKEEAHKP